jgi:hypothetical protein
MNTTQLISHWTMEGASRDVDGRFRTTDDIRTILAGHHEAPADSVAATVQVRGADEDDWALLRVGGEGDGGRVW